MNYQSDNDIVKEFEEKFDFIVEKTKESGVYRTVLYTQNGTTAEGRHKLKSFIQSTLEARDKEFKSLVEEERKGWMTGAAHVALDSILSELTNK